MYQFSWKYFLQCHLQHLVFEGQCCINIQFYLADTACKNSQGSVEAIQENLEKYWLNEKYTLNLEEKVVLREHLQNYISFGDDGTCNLGVAGSYEGPSRFLVSGVQTPSWVIQQH